MLLEGETEKLVPLVLLPIEIPPVATVYHCIVAPAEMAFKLLAEPLHTEVPMAVTEVGTAGSGLTVTVTPPEGPAKIPVHGLAVPSTLK